MSGSKIKSSNKKRSNKNKQHQNQHQNQNQQGGSSGNSSSVALGYGGVTPMPNYNSQGGSALLADTAAPFSSVSVPVVSVNAGNGFMKGGNVPVVPVTTAGNVQVPVVPVTTAGNALIKGGNVPLPVVPVTTAGNVQVPVVPVTAGNGLIKGGSIDIGLKQGGNVLNNLAVPAVLLYANQTFGKKKNYTAKKYRKYKKNRRNRSRRYKRN